MSKSFTTIVPAELHSMDLSLKKNKSSFGNFVFLNIKFTTPPLKCGLTPQVRSFGSGKTCNISLRMSDPEFNEWVDAMETEMTAIVQNLTE